MNLNWILSRLLIIGLISFLEGADMKKPNNSVNLTSIQWAHAVNSQKALTEALQSNVHMIEADIVLGKLDTTSRANDDLIPIMAHPPNITSDISLEKFLLDITAKTNKTNIKGVKLDFKTIEAFMKSMPILKTQLSKMNNSIWLNADIIKGPVNSTTKPVEPNQFLTGCKEFKNITLSLGWTTMWGKNYTQGSYNKSDIDNMVKAIKGQNISNTNITFAVRAGIATQSVKQLDELIKDVGSNNTVTLSIWSHKDDNVDPANLTKLIKHFGFNKVYLDVPEELSTKLHLNKANSAMSNNFINFSIITLCILIASLALQRNSI